MDYNETKCDTWSQQNWFDKWRKGDRNYVVPKGNYFGEDANGIGLTLTQACPEIWNHSKFNIRM